jgi:transposase
MRGNALVKGPISTYHLAMSFTRPSPTPDAAKVAAMDTASIVGLLQTQALKIDTLEHQLEWFKRQVFGQKSERALPPVDTQQMHLGELAPLPAQAGLESPLTVPEHQRRKRVATDFSDDKTPSQFFDEARVPVQTIEVPNPAIAGLSADQFEVIGEKVSYRLAQRPGSNVVLKYVRSVVKLLETQEIHCPGAPDGVIQNSRADVSFIVGVMVDKFEWHLPLYRQHLRLVAQGFKLSRQWLTQLVTQGAQLLEPIYEALLESIRTSRVKAMDEVPIKAGLNKKEGGHGKMGSGYFWPIYGEHDEVCFPYFESRRAEHVQQALGLMNQSDGVLLTDGYAAYSKYAKLTGVTHAQCWAHTRRGFFEAQDVEPEVAAQAMEQIAAMYRAEEHIRQAKLKGEAKRLHRLTHSKPVVEQFFAWVDDQLARQGLLPSNPMTKALAYARDRRAELQVYLGDPDVPIDTNHLERALRVIPMGRKNWLFCWTELGAKHAGIVQSLIVTCRLHGIDPTTYLIDVLQRVAIHPAARVAELTPRMWKQHFASTPMRSDVYGQA